MTPGGAMLVLGCLSLREPRPARRRRGLAFAAAGTVVFAVSPAGAWPAARLPVKWAPMS